VLNDQYECRDHTSLKNSRAGNAKIVIHAHHDLRFRHHPTGIAGLNLRRPWLPPAGTSQSSSRVGSSPPQTVGNSPWRITSYPHVDISIPFEWNANGHRGYRAGARGDRRTNPAERGSGAKVPVPKQYRRYLLGVPL